MTEEKVLKSPTVGEVIEFLKQFPPEANFRIEDADTYWTISNIYTEFTDDTLWLKGRYMDMGPTR